MPDTDRWRNWLAMLNASDNIVFQIFTMAASAVVLWEFLRRLPIPEPGRGYVLLAYLAGSLGLYVYVVTGGVLVAAGGSAAVLFVAGVAMGAGAAAWAGASNLVWAWDWRRPLRRRRGDRLPNDNRR